MNSIGGYISYLRSHWDCFGYIQTKRLQIHDVTKVANNRVKIASIIASARITWSLAATCTRFGLLLVQSSNGGARQILAAGKMSYVRPEIK